MYTVIPLEDRKLLKKLPCNILVPCTFFKFNGYLLKKRITNIWSSYHYDIYFISNHKKINGIDLGYGVYMNNTSILELFKDVKFPEMTSMTIYKLIHEFKPSAFDKIYLSSNIRLSSIFEEYINYQPRGHIIKSVFRIFDFEKVNKFKLL